MIRHNPVKITRCVRAQVGNIQIDQIGLDMIENWVDDVDTVHELAAVSYTHLTLPTIYSV